MRRRNLWVVAGLIQLLMVAGGWAAISEGTFKELHGLLNPTKEEEAWRTIPWKTGLLDAQRQAAAEGRPIFIWAMDGHPLGCT
jgi:hypothetical protein